MKVDHLNSKLVIVFDDDSRFETTALEPFLDKEKLEKLRVVIEGTVTPKKKEGK